MIIKLPNGEERTLSNDDCLDKKLSTCRELIEEFDEYIMDSWENHSVNYFLNGLANYICWHKEEEYTDKENNILSNSREKQMSKKRYHGRYRKDTLFTDLSSKDELEIFGEMTNNAQ